jgi:PAS domain S-box-containing protein
MAHAQPVGRPSADSDGAVPEAASEEGTSTDAADEFFALSLDLVGEAGSDGYFHRLNPTFARALGYAETELVGAPFISFVHPEDRAATRAELEQLGRGQPTRGFENRFRRKAGDYRWLAWTAVPTPEGLVHAAARDITGRKLAEARGAAGASTRAGDAAAAAIEDFLVSVAHDLQQPLALIKGQVQLIQRQLVRGDTVEPARLDRGLGYVNAAVMRMRGMLQEILDNTLEQAGQPLGVLLSPTDLVALTRQVVSEHQVAFDEHQFVLDAEPDEVLAMVDGARVQRVLENLLSNAVKYSPDGGTIRIALTLDRGADTGWVVIAVHDSGLGISAADLPRVFDRFYRGSNVVGCMAGNGVGLAGARQLVELHHGSIAVESEEGRGSTFTVRLPLGAR